MKWSSGIVITCCFMILLWSCKPQRQVIGITQPVADTLTIAEPKYFITQDGDTLTSLTEEVEIGIHRVLKDTLIIVGVGDIMMGTNFPEKKYLPGNEGKDLWVEVKDTLKQADVTFGNLEGVILDDGGTQKKCKNPKICYLFRTPESYLVNLVDAGFDLVSMANNHAGDFGQEGRDNTMRALDSIGIGYAGVLGAQYTIIKRDGMKYGLAAFAPNKGTVSIHNLDRALEIVNLLDSLTDVVIISFHAGAEGRKHEHVTRKTEIFYGEDRGNVYELARTLIDAGGDVIFGHGPHVTRAIDIYKNRFIIYSLGNFCTYGRFNLSGVNGIAPIIKVYTDPKGKFIYGEIIPIQQFGAGGPKIDDKKKAIKKIQELTKKDFPENNLMIDDSGFITYIND